jgi:hypothetical protein
MRITPPSLLDPDGLFSLMANALMSPAPGSEGFGRRSADVDAAPSPAQAPRQGVLRRVARRFSLLAPNGARERAAFVPYY